MVDKKLCPECGKEFDPAIDDFNSVKCFSCNFDSVSESAYPEENELPKAVKKWLKTNYPQKDNIDSLSKIKKSHTLPAELRKIDDVEEISSGWKAKVKFSVTEMMDWVPLDSELLNNETHVYEAELTFDKKCWKVLSAKIQRKE